MTEAIGRKSWAIAEGYIPPYGHGPEPEFTSHETACLLNAFDRDAHVSIFVYFADREPAGPYELTVPARRTKHVRFNELAGWVERGIPRVKMKIGRHPGEDVGRVRAARADTVGRGREALRDHGFWKRRGQA